MRKALTLKRCPLSTGTASSTSSLRLSTSNRKAYELRDESKLRHLTVDLNGRYDDPFVPSFKYFKDPSEVLFASAKIMDLNELVQGHSGGSALNALT